MGSCISKCNPQKNSQEDDDDHVQYEYVKDKLVILQVPKPSKNSQISSSICPPPSSSSSSLASLSSFSSTASSATTLSSSSSSSSAASCFKDRSFSNDFLLSCAQEHDHILDIKRNKQTHCPCHHQNMSTMLSTSSKKVYSRSSSSPLSSKPPSPQRECPSTLKKRPRANSPTMVRQKSFRKEHDHQQQLKGGTNIGGTSNVATCTYHPFPSTRATTLRSPSPSRRFPSNSKDDMKESSFRRSVNATKGNNGIISRSSSLRRDNHFKPTTPNNNEVKMKTNNALKKVSPKIDEMEIIGDQVKSSDQDLDSLLMEDINNPLIALDCFIFL